MNTDAIYTEEKNTEEETIHRRNKDGSPETPASFDALYRDAEEHDDYWLAGVVQDLTEDICRLMAERGLSRSELARRLGTSPAYVTKILRGNANFTLATLVKLARALETDLQLRFLEAPAREATARGAAREGREPALRKLPVKVRTAARGTDARGRQAHAARTSL